MYPAASPLLTDLYQLNMLQAYLDHGKTDTAVFEFFVRRLPARRGFLMAAGLEQALDFLENLQFSNEEINWLRQNYQFTDRFLNYLVRLRFTGDVDAMPEGTILFANEPVIRVIAPLPEAQLVETRLINIPHFQTVVASKAARMVLAAPGKQLVDFGLRRSHGAEAGLMAARASYLAGFTGTATVLARKDFGIPIFGTMAHSLIQAHDDESATFFAFARSRPDNLVLLIDTYDTEAAARKVVKLSSDAPALDCAYKLQEYAGIARRKRSIGKATWPGRKQVWRSFGADGRMTGDVLALQDVYQEGEPLLIPAMRHGQRLASPPTLADIRQRAARALAQLPEPLRRLGGTAIPVTIAPGLIALTEEVDRRNASSPP